MNHLPLSTLALAEPQLWIASGDVLSYVPYAYAARILVQNPRGPDFVKRHLSERKMNLG
jgi:hypothetical protein